MGVLSNPRKVVHRVYADDRSVGLCHWHHQAPLDDHWVPYENEMKNGCAINHEMKARRRVKGRETGPGIASKANR